MDRFRVTKCEMVKLQVEMEKAQMNDLAVILLNWNNYSDTIECLKSLREQDMKNFTIIVIDTGSENDSVSRILDTIDEQETLVLDYRKSYDDAITTEEIHPPLSTYQLVIIRCKENFGFAKANNIGIKYAIADNYKAVMLLNNDTILAENCLRVMYERLFVGAGIDVVIPTIYYYDDPTKIWNCGGEPIAFGRKKRYSSEEASSHGDAHEYETKLVTGCALVAKKCVFIQYGVLDDSFFFGEEDTEFSERMNNNHVKMLCLKDATLWHKVSSSQPKNSGGNIIRKTILEFSNRMVRYRRSHSALQSAAVFELYNILLLLVCMRSQNSRPNVKAMRRISTLFRATASRSSVDREAYRNIMDEYNKITGAYNG